MPSPYKYCPSCATPLQLLAQMEDGGEKQRSALPGLWLDALEQSHAGAGCRH
jgi:hypothetical protein